MLIRTLSSPTLGLALSILLGATACTSGRASEQTQVNTSAYGAQLAQQDVQIEAAMQEGKIDTWLAAPVYLHEDAMVAIYRGPKPNAPTSSMPPMRSSLSSSDVSKIAWKRGYNYQDALLNMMRVTSDGKDELLFKDTPHAFAELVFLTPHTEKEAPVKSPASSSPHVIKLEDGEITHTIHVVTPPAQPPTQGIAKAPGPQLITAPSAPHHVAHHFNTWELPQVKGEIAVGCAVLRREVTDADGEKGWRYHGEIWVRHLGSDRVFTHGSEELEPTAWQLHPGERPQLEVTMSDAEGWPSRIDFIDLNTLEVRSTPSREALKKLGIK